MASSATTDVEALRAPTAGFSVQAEQLSTINEVGEVGGSLTGGWASHMLLRETWADRCAPAAAEPAPAGEG